MRFGEHCLRPGVITASPSVDIVFTGGTAWAPAMVVNVGTSGIMVR